jgi:hypothetical protein
MNIVMQTCRTGITLIEFCRSMAGDSCGPAMLLALHRVARFTITPHRPAADQNRDTNATGRRNRNCYTLSRAWGHLLKPASL